GALGIEALSRGALGATFIDSSRAAARAIDSNLAALDLGGRGRMIIGDVRRALQELRGLQFELLFVDPPYKDDSSGTVLGMIADLNLVADGGWVVIRQHWRAPGPPSSCGNIELANVATIGEHRIAFYSRPERVLSDRDATGG